MGYSIQIELNSKTPTQRILYSLESILESYSFTSVELSDHTLSIHYGAMPIDFYDTLYGFVYYISDTYGKKAMDISTGLLLPYYLHDQELILFFQKLSDLPENVDDTEPLYIIHSNGLEKIDDRNFDDIIKEYNEECIYNYIIQSVEKELFGNELLISYFSMGQEKLKSLIDLLNE